MDRWRRLRGWLQLLSSPLVGQLSGGLNSASKSSWNVSLACRAGSAAQSCQSIVCRVDCCQARNCSLPGAEVLLHHTHCRTMCLCRDCEHVQQAARCSC